MKKFFLLIVVVAVFVGYVMLPSESGPKKPGEEAFGKASSAILSKSNGVAHGNTPAAREMAKNFSTTMGLLQKLAFTGGKENRTVSLTGESFLTYCHQTEDGVCFLVHVPQLKGYKDDVRDALIDISWKAAVSTTSELHKAKPIKIGVGLKGAVFYGGTAVGMSNVERPQTQNGFSVDDDVLFSFFTGKAPSDAPAVQEAKPGDAKAVPAAAEKNGLKPEKTPALADKGASKEPK